MFSTEKDQSQENYAALSYFGNALKTLGDSMSSIMDSESDQDDSTHHEEGEVVDEHLTWESAWEQRYGPVKQMWRQKLAYDKQEVEAMLDQDQAFEELKRKLRKKGCITNIYLQQNMHHYLYNLKNKAAAKSTSNYRKEIQLRSRSLSN